MQIDDKKLDEIKKNAEEGYKKVGVVNCPYLKRNVSFNAKGLEHIKFKGRHKARSNEDQYIRLRSLPLAKKIVELSHTLQGFQERNEMVSVKRTEWNHEMKSVNYFEFVAVIGDVRVRVIIKKIEGGEPHFWSIIPFWKMDINKKRLIHNGNPSED